MSINTLKGLKALVVDDYVNICHLVELILDTQGIESTCVTSAYKAIEVYPSLQPDILISDIEMPGEDGFSLIRRIRILSSGEGRKVPAIAMTGLPLEEVKPKAVKAGFQRFIAKPIEVTELLTAVAELLQPSVKE